MTPVPLRSRAATAPTDPPETSLAAVANLLSNASQQPQARLRPWLATLLGLVVAALIGGSVVTARWKSATVAVDGKVVAVRGFLATVADALERAQVTLNEGDVVSPAPDTRLAEGASIEITRAIRVTLEVDGEKRSIATVAATVGELLTQAGVSLGEGDHVTPEAKAPLTADAVIQVWRVRREVTTRQIKVAFQTQRKYDPNLAAGITKVLQEGKAGVKEVSVETTYENGKAVRTRVVSQRVIAQPVPRVVAVGSSGSVTIAGRTYEFSRALDMEATGYTAGPESTGKYADGYTYTGLKAQRGVVAVDPRVIPLGSRVYVEGYGFAIAADIGSAIKGNKIDLAFDTVAEALKWGRRRVRVYVLR